MGYIIVVKDRKLETAEMAEMAEMNKAFDDFSKACDKAIGKCQDFIDMDTNAARRSEHK